MTEPWSETDRWASRRRPFERAELRLIELAHEGLDPEGRGRLEALRYALNFAKLLKVQNVDGEDVDLEGVLGPHAERLLASMVPALLKAQRIEDALSLAPEVLPATCRARASVLEHLPLDRESLELEVTTRHLAVASGGGGGAGYVYPGAYDLMERIGLTPSLMVGTSMGALLSMFRCKAPRFDLAALVAAARVLSWSRVFRVLETGNRYGLPAALRLYLRAALGDLFRVDGRSMQLSDMAIPMYSVVTGITVDALKHDLDYYEHLLDQEVASMGSFNASTAIKTFGIFREFYASRQALRMVVLGRDEGTEHFDTLDAAGFSAAIPGVIHYDVMRDDPRMRKILDELYERHGISRLGEGGMVSNLPARVAWESVVSGRFGRRNVAVVALDCFAPSLKRLPWYAFMQAVRQANVVGDLAFADLYVPLHQTLSPLNLVPSTTDALQAIRWGRTAMTPHLDQLAELCRPLDVLPEE